VHELDSASPYAGVTKAQVNMTSLVGGAHRFFGHPKADGREMRIEACRIFRTTYERSQIGAPKAVDPSVEPVDGGGISPGASLDRGIDALARWSGIVDAMTRMELRRLVFVIIGEWGPTPYAKFIYNVRKANAQQISKGMVDFRGVVDKLAGHLRLVTT
jgi:hypothetical protein